LENIVADADNDVEYVEPNTTPVLVAGPAPVPTITAVRVTVPTVVTPVSTTIFHIGQRVYITNRTISHVVVCRVTEADRTAIVLLHLVSPSTPSTVTILIDTPRIYVLCNHV
jgi:hypothetical protein